MSVSTEFQGVSMAQCTGCTEPSRKLQLNIWASQRPLRTVLCPRVAKGCALMTLTTSAGVSCCHSFWDNVEVGLSLTMCRGRAHIPGSGNSTHLAGLQLSVWQPICISPGRSGGRSSLCNEEAHLQKLSEPSRSTVIHSYSNQASHVG